MKDFRKIKKESFSRIFTYILFLVPVGVAANLIFALMTTDRGILEYLHNFKIEYLVGSVILCLFPLLINSYRLGVWTQFLKKPLPFSDRLRIAMAYELGSAITPTSGGGGYLKLGMLVRKGFSLGQATSLMTLANVEHIFFYALAIPVAFVLTASLKEPVLQAMRVEIKKMAGKVQFIHLLFVVLIIITAGIIISRFLYLKFKARLKAFWQGFIEVYQAVIRKGKTKFCLNVLLAGLDWVCRFSIITLLLAGFGFPVHPVTFFLLQWIIRAIMTFVPTPGGAGAAETTFYFIFSYFVPRDALGIVTAGWRFVTFYFLLIICAIFFLLLNTRLPLPRQKKTVVANQLAG